MSDELKEQFEKTLKSMIKAYDSYGKDGMSEYWYTYFLDMDKYIELKTGVERKSIFNMTLEEADANTRRLKEARKELFAEYEKRYYGRAIKSTN